MRLDAFRPSMDTLLGRNTFASKLKDFSDLTSVYGAFGFSAAKCFNLASVCVEEQG